MRDVQEGDLHGLLTSFYDRIEKDPLLAPYFAGLDMQLHMPRITDFWSTLIFHTQRYSGNAFLPHKSMPGLTATHFEHWLHTLEATVDDNFAGPNAIQMKELAHRIAYSMQVRLGIQPFAPYRPDQIDRPHVPVQQLRDHSNQNNEQTQND